MQDPKLLDLNQIPLESSTSQGSQRDGFQLKPVINNHPGQRMPMHGPPMPPHPNQGFQPPPRGFPPPYNSRYGPPPPMMSKHQDYPEIEVIKNRLYFYSGPKPPSSSVEAYFFSIDEELQYDPFNEDFGPLSLAQLHKYIRELVRLMVDPDYKKFRLYHYCSDQYDKQANGAFLIGCFMMVVLKMKASRVCQLFEPYLNGIVVPYRDASYGECFYPCTLIQCWEGLEYAMKLGWYSFKDFDNKEYEYYEKLENGDLNWIIPGKFMAFMGPLDDPPLAYNNYDRMGNTPEDYIQVFKHFNVTRVIRLNDPKYDKRTFEEGGIAHSDLFFIDGSVPPPKIVENFFKIAEAEPGAIAIHCKAGLGRTGTLIGLFAMKHYKFPAAAFIGWIRIARPGSILGPQQYYLLDMEEIYLGKDSAAYRARGQQRKLEMSPIDIRKSKYGDQGQGEFLTQRKFATPSRHSMERGHPVGLSSSGGGNSAFMHHPPPAPPNQHIYQQMVNQRNSGAVVGGLPPQGYHMHRSSQETIPEVNSGSRTKTPTPHGSEGGRGRVKDKGNK